MNPKNMKPKETFLIVSFGIGFTSFLIGLSIAFMGTLQVASQEVIAALPEETVACLPRQGIKLAAANPQLLAKARYTTVNYFFYHLQKDPHEYVVTVDQEGRCKLITLSAQDALSAQIPLPIAKEFTLMKLQKAIARVGKPELKRQMQQVFLSSPNDSLSPEMRWAIDKLGLS